MLVHVNVKVEREPRWDLPVRPNSNNRISGYSNLFENTNAHTQARGRTPCLFSCGRKIPSNRTTQGGPLITCPTMVKTSPDGRFRFVKVSRRGEISGVKTIQSKKSPEFDGAYKKSPSSTAPWGKDASDGCALSYIGDATDGGSSGGPRARPARHPFPFVAHPSAAGANNTHVVVHKEGI